MPDMPGLVARPRFLRQGALETIRAAEGLPDSKMTRANFNRPLPPDPVARRIESWWMCSGNRFEVDVCNGDTQTTVPPHRVQRHHGSEGDSHDHPGAAGRRVVPGTVRPTILLGAAALSAACTTAVQAPDSPLPDTAGPLEPLAARCGQQHPFVATGTEPGWRLTLSAATVDLEADYGTTRVRLPTPAPRQRGDAVVYSGEGEGHTVAIAVRDAYCTNAMSGKPFPCAVRVTLDGDRVDGCGGDPASLLTGPAWQIGSLGGEPVPADVQPTLRFSTDGSVAGFDGCNRFRGHYRITGVGVRFAELTGTRMACTGNRDGVARKLHATLEAVQLFRLTGGQLILASHGEERLTAQR